MFLLYKVPLLLHISRLESRNDFFQTKPRFQTESSFPMQYGKQNNCSPSIIETLERKLENTEFSTYCSKTPKIGKSRKNR